MEYVLRLTLYYFAKLFYCYSTFTNKHVYNDSLSQGIVLSTFKLNEIFNRYQHSITFEPGVPTNVFSYKNKNMCIS